LVTCRKIQCRNLGLTKQSGPTVRGFPFAVRALTKGTISMHTVTLDDFHRLRPRHRLDAQWPGRGAASLYFVAELRRGRRKTGLLHGHAASEHSCSEIVVGPPPWRAGVTGIFESIYDTARDGGSGGCTACFTGANIPVTSYWCRPPPWRRSPATVEGQ